MEITAKASRRTKESKDFRLALQKELKDRCEKNPNYSLRSFAKFLSISPAALSSILNGKRPLTTKMRDRLGLRLGIPLEQLATFKAKPHGNSRFQNEDTGTSYQEISLDIFSVISEPYHYAILELLKTKDFESTPRWIAKRLGLTISEINFALERLERVGLLERDENGNYADTTEGFTTDIREGLTSEGQRKFQSRSLTQAAAIVETVPVTLRDNTSITMAINKSDLPKAKAMIKDFRRRMSQELEANTSLDEVYQLTISFVPITDLATSKTEL